MSYMYNNDTKHAECVILHRWTELQLNHLLYNDTKANDINAIDELNNTKGDVSKKNPL